MIRRTATGADGFMLRYAAMQDSRLSYRARGLLASGLSRPSGWRTDADQLAHEGKEGREAVLTALSELESFGYLLRTVVRGAGGRLVTIWELSDSPQVGPKTGYRTPVNRGSARRTPVNRVTDDRTPVDQTPEHRTPVDRTPDSPTPYMEERDRGETPPPAPSRARTAPEVEALVVVVRTALPRTTPPPGRSVLVREASRLAGLGWTPERLQAAVRGHDWTGARSGAVVTWLRDLDAPEDEPQAAHGRPEWCGECDDTTRMVSEPQTGAPVRCPRCHPLAGTMPESVARRLREAEDEAALRRLHLVPSPRGDH